MNWRRLLLPLSWIFGLIVALRRAVYNLGLIKSVHLGPKTISIGNIEVGGTGKSPFVSGLAAALAADGFRPMVLARGYGSQLPRHSAAWFLGSRLIEVRDAAHHSSRSMDDLKADEARMVSAQNPTVPVIIGRDRVGAYRLFSDFITKYSPTHLILDDGFQHWRILRDIDIVLLSEDFFGDSLLPAGALREPVGALRRADAVVRVVGRNGAQVAPDAVHAILPASIYEIPGQVVYEGLEPAGIRSFTKEAKPDFPVRPLVVCGIARPESFLKALGRAGISPLRVIKIKDHGRFSSDLLSPESVRGADAIVTTSKDYWRDPEILNGTGLPVWILSMRIVFPFRNFF